MSLAVSGPTAHSFGPKDVNPYDPSSRGRATTSGQTTKSPRKRSRSRKRKSSEATAASSSGTTKPMTDEETDKMMTRLNELQTQGTYDSVLASLGNLRDEANTTANRDWALYELQRKWDRIFSTKGAPTSTRVSGVTGEMASKSAATTDFKERFGKQIARAAKLLKSDFNENERRYLAGKASEMIDQADLNTSLTGVTVPSTGPSESKVLKEARKQARSARKIKGERKKAAGETTLPTVPSTYKDPTADTVATDETKILIRMDDEGSLVPLHHRFDEVRGSAKADLFKRRVKAEKDPSCHIRVPISTQPSTYDYEGKSSGPPVIDTAASSVVADTAPTSKSARKLRQLKKRQARREADSRVSDQHSTMQDMLRQRTSGPDAGESSAMPSTSNALITKADADMSTMGAFKVMQKEQKAINQALADAIENGEYIMNTTTGQKSLQVNHADAETGATSVAKVEMSKTEAVVTREVYTPYPEAAPEDINTLVSKFINQSQGNPEDQTMTDLVSGIAKTAAVDMSLVPTSQSRTDLTNVADTSDAGKGLSKRQLKKLRRQARESQTAGLTEAPTGNSSTLSKPGMPSETAATVTGNRSALDTLISKINQTKTAKQGQQLSSSQTEDPWANSNTKGTRSGISKEAFERSLRGSKAGTWGRRTGEKGTRATGTSGFGRTQPSMISAAA